MKLYARTTESGTACSETCLCEEHLTDHNKELFSNPGGITGPDAPTGDWVDCSENDAIQCQAC